MTQNPGDVAEEIVIKRRSFQQYVLEKLAENPNLRMPIQKGDFAGIDVTNGWDYSLDGDPTRFYKTNDEIRLFAILINHTYYKRGRVQADELFAEMHGTPQQQEQQQQQQDNPTLLPKETQIGPPASSSVEDLKREARLFQGVITESYDIIDKPAPKLPDSFKGVKYNEWWWEQVQLHCITRRDLDMILPDDLPPDIIPDCYEIQFMPRKDSGNHIVFTVASPAGTVVYSEVMPAGYFAISAKGLKKDITLKDRLNS